MNWTVDKPTVPGWYWYRTSEQEKSLLKLDVYAFSDQMKAIWPSGRSESVISMPGVVRSGRAAPMNWSTKKPFKPGWYWWRPLSTDTPTLVEVTIDGEGTLRTSPPASSVASGCIDDTWGEWTERVEMPL